MLVLRCVRKPPENTERLERNQPQGLPEFRGISAWVLLGEPGAGKSTALEQEADATGGQFLRVDEFINTDVKPDWCGKTLFLDGLDEVRAGSSADSVLLRVRRQLQRLGNPAFRIACRAADWYGSTDAADLSGASPDGQLEILLLDPLSPANTLDILRENHGIPEPAAFVEEADKRGIADLLENPQTLGLLADAVRDGHWPKTRDETYQLACVKLAQEENKRHRDRTRGKACSVEKVLDAAGHLCAVLLLSDKTGLALDPARADERFPDLNSCAPPDSEAAIQAVGSRLFRAPLGEERVTPAHRSIAEYIAARWLARQIDGGALPLMRAMNLLLSPDGGVVAGLRGLFAWLALRSRIARPLLITADPLTVVIYGDVYPMPIADKRRILEGLRREAGRFGSFHWDASMAHAFGALSSSDLREDFLAILRARGRDDASQALTDCVLDILMHGDAQPALESTLLSIVRDDTRWLGARKSALHVWLKEQGDPQAAVEFLDETINGRVTDVDDELAGTLLRHLYPKHIPANTLLRHLHLPKDPSRLGSYVWFWEHDLPECAPDDHLPILLDGLVGHSELGSRHQEVRRLDRMASVLLARGLEVHGDAVTDDRLLDWLGIGLNEDGDTAGEKVELQKIAGWLSTRPHRYKNLLALCFRRCEQHEHPAYCVHLQSVRLHGAAVPDDIGVWHLEQASVTTNVTFARMHLAEAVTALVRRTGDAGLSIELIEEWAKANPAREEWLRPLLFSETQDWQIESAARKKARKQKHANARRARTIAVTPHLSAIRQGSARADLMHQLAGVWKNLFSDVHGETLLDRFGNYAENGDDLLAAADAGFRLCHQRSDLPAVPDIIELSLKQRQHLIRLPCLVGMDLLWENGAAAIARLPDETLRRMVAFRLTYGVDNPPAWFIHLVRNAPALVAEVLVLYAGATLKARKDYVDSIYPLQHDLEYRAVATIAAPGLLDVFPVRSRAGQLRHLEYLLKAALRYTPDSLKLLIEKKLAMKGMDAAQRVFWYGTATLIDPETHETALWRYVGKSHVRGNYLAGFLSDRDDKFSHDYDLSVRTIGNLIELIAPHAEIEWQRGVRFVTDAVRRGDQVRALINRLSSMATAEAAGELDRLLGLATLSKLKRTLESARHEQTLRQRENEFRFLPLQRVAQVLANKAPASISDLAALALDHLDAIAVEIRQENDDGFRAFWNIENKKPISQREENLCRDAILTRLRARLLPLDVESQPEGDYTNDKRADLRLSYRTEFELPIEIKRDSNPSLWHSLREQLIAQYAVAPRAYGHGIYLVLWFGGQGQPPTSDGGKKPISPAELQQRLNAVLDPIDRQRIFVRVLDVSWPGTG